MAFSQIQLMPGPSTIRPTIQATAGALVNYIITVKNADGHVVDLTPYVVAYSESNPPGGPCPIRTLPITKGILFTIRTHRNQFPAEYQMPVQPYGDPKNGEVEIVLKPCTFDNPGLYLAELSLITDAKIQQLYNFYIEAAPTLAWSTDRDPITIEEVRLWARDNSAADNYLLDEVEYKDTEIVAAIRRAVDMWNSTPPVMTAYTYNPSTFPYRSQWLDVTIGFLMNIASLNYLRNGLPSQAGGVSIDDKLSKYQPYAQEAKMRIQEFKDWMKMIKPQLNADQAWGRLGTWRMP